MHNDNLVVEIDIQRRHFDEVSSHPGRRLVYTPEPTCSDKDVLFDQQSHSRRQIIQRPHTIEPYPIAKIRPISSTTSRGFCNLLQDEHTPYALVPYLQSSTFNTQSTHDAGHGRVSNAFDVERRDDDHGSIHHTVCRSLFSATDIQAGQWGLVVQRLDTFDRTSDLCMLRRTLLPRCWIALH